MKPLLIPYLFVVVCTACSCATQKKTASEWIGKTKDQLVQTMGQPVTITNNGKQGQIFTYSLKLDIFETPGVYLTNSGDGYTRMTRPDTTARQYTVLKMFYINTSGVVYDYKQEKI